MASVGSLSSGTTSNIYGGSRKGVSGLISGMDTDEMIKGMTSGTRGKLAKILQDKQGLAWKTEAYRSVSDKMIEFSKKYTTFSSDTNLYSENFFARSKITSKGANGKYVDVSGFSDSVDNISIAGIRQLAKNANAITNRLASDAKLSTGEVNVDEITDKSIFAGKSLFVGYGGSVYDVVMDETLDYSTPAKIAESIEKSMEAIDIPGGKKLSDVVKMGSNGDKLTIDFDDPADTNSIKMWSSPTMGVMEALGIEKGATVGIGKPIEGKDIVIADTIQTTTFKERIAGKTMTFVYNGIAKTIKMPTADEMKNTKIADGDKVDFTYTNDMLKDHIQKQMDGAFGTGRIKVDLQPETTPGSGFNGLSFQTWDVKNGVPDTSSVLKLSASAAGMTGKNGAFKINIGESNRLNLQSSLSESGLNGAGGILEDDKFKINVNGKEFEFTGKDSIVNIISKINLDPDVKVKISYLETSDKFSIVSTESGESGKIDITDTEGNLGALLFGTQGPGNGYDFYDGQDAIISVDYDGAGGQDPVEITRNSNIFIVDGLNVTINGTFGEYDANGKLKPGTAEAVTFDAKVDTEKITTAVKDMIKDYNEISKLANDMVSEKKDRKYAPLTAEQKEGMTESEIKLWEEKAKEGLLFNDPELRGFTGDIRFLFSSNSEAIKNLDQMGITMSDNKLDNGKVLFNESKFKTALEGNPTVVQKMFAEPIQKRTNSAGELENDPVSGGIMGRMKNVFDKYAGIEGSRKGIFVEMAGSQYSPLSMIENHMQERIKILDDQIYPLQLRLQAEEERYSREFTRMEMYLSQMNSQSSWLAQQTGG